MSIFIKLNIWKLNHRELKEPLISWSVMEELVLVLQDTCQTQVEEEKLMEVDNIISKLHHSNRWNTWYISQKLYFGSLTVSKITNFPHHPLVACIYMHIQPTLFQIQSVCSSWPPFYYCWPQWWEQHDCREPGHCAWPQLVLVTGHGCEWHHGHHHGQAEQCYIVSHQQLSKTELIKRITHYNRIKVFWSEYNLL